MDKEGYIDKFDVENILNIADNRTDRIIVQYIDENQTIELNNIDNELKNELESKIEGNYFKFNYEHKNNETTIYIEKYQNELKSRKK